MKYKKTIIFTVCIIAYMIFIITQYNARNNQNISLAATEQEEVHIVTSFYPMYMHVKELTKGIPVQVTNMADSQVGCLHDYQLRVEDMKTLQKADILVMNGFGAENFIAKAYEQNKHLQVINASEALEVIWGYSEGHEGEYDHEEGHEHEDEHNYEEEYEHVEEHSHEDDFADEHSGHNHANEHIWVSIAGSIEQVKQISKELQALDSTHAADYQANEKRYVGALEGLKEEVEAELGNLSGAQIALVHNSFEYLAEELGLEIAATISGSSEEAPTAAEVEKIIKDIKAADIHSIFSETQYKQLGIVQTIANETGTTVYELDSFVTEAKEINQDEIEYVQRMRKNIKVLKEAYGL